MGDITEFLLARLDEDEAHVDPTYHHFRKTDFINQERGEQATCWALLPSDRICVQRDGHMGDPARVLAECEAKRGIVEEHPRTKYHGCCQTCLVPEDREKGPDYWMQQEWPCQTLLALAAVYSDHPDYDEAWRP